jgi:PAS domain S-box-containing protein
MHRLLERQLKRLGLQAESAPSDDQVWQQLLERISRIYEEADQDRYLEERSLSISSREMQELHENLRQTSETRIAVERDRLQAVISSVGDGLCVLDQEGGLLSINPKGERLLGWKEDELTGQPVLDLVELRSEEQSASAVSSDPWRDVVRSRQPYRNEDGRFKRKDGATLSVSYVVNPIVKDDEFLGAVLVFRDITEQTQAAEELVRLRRAIEQASDGIAVFDMEGRVQFANPSWADMHGYAPQEIQSKDMSLFHTQEQLQQEVAPCRQKVLETGSHQCQIGHVKKDGTPFPTMMSNTLLKDEQGNPVGFLATARDISLQARLDEELRQQGALLQGVARAAEQLLTDPNPTLAINQALNTLGQALGVDRVYVFENHPHPRSGELVRSQRFEWVSASVESEIDNPDLQDASYDPFWYEPLSTGKVINCLTQEAPDLVRPMLESQGIHSLLVVPINIDEQFWGYIGFEDCHTEHHWTKNEETALTIAAGSIGGVIRRQRLAQAIQRSLERRGRQMQISTLIAQRIAAAPTLDELFRRVVTLIKEQLGYYHVQIYRYELALNAVALVCGYGEIGQQMLEAGYSLKLGQGVVGSAAATGRTVMVRDVAQDPNRVANPLLPDVKGELAIPIKLRDQVLSILAVQSDRAGVLTADTQIVLEGLCGQIATAIESTRLRQEMEENLRELNALYRATSRQGWQDYREAAALPGGYRFDRTTIQPDDELWVPEIEQAVTQDQLVISAKEDAEGNVAVAPLSVRGEILGALGVHDDPQHPLSPDDLALVQAVSEQVGLALEGARLFEQTQAALDQTEELYAGSERVVHATTPGEILQALVDSTALQQLDRVTLVILDHPWRPGGTPPSGVTPIAVWDRAAVLADREPQSFRDRYTFDQFPIIRLFDPSEPTVIKDVSTDERIDETSRQLVKGIGSQGIMVFPLMIGGQFIGGVIGLSKTSIELSDEAVRQIASLAEQAATVLQSQLLFDQTQAALFETKALHQAGAELNVAQSYEDILTALRRYTVLGQADRLVSIDLFDRPWADDDWPDWLIVISRWPYLSREEAERRYLVRDYPSLFELLGPEQPMIIADTENDPRLDENTRALFVQQFKARSIVSVPLTVGGQWLGYVNGQYNENVHFSETEIRRLTALTSQAAIAIQSLRQLEDIQARVQREQQLREIAARLRTPPDVDGVMRTLAQELGQTLGRRAVVRLNRQALEPTVSEQKPNRNHGGRS